MSEIVIVGAGLSGMVAAINLARQGREVRVLDREKRIGGSPRLHPSIHVTPLNQEGILDYTGVDVGPAFAKVSGLNVYVEDKGFTVPDTLFYSVERGPRETSLDSHLYNMALREGVKFEFSQRITKLTDIPPGSVIATGLHGELVKEAGGSVTFATGYGCYMDSDREGFSSVYLDRYASDYFYLGILNGMAYGLIFGRYQRITRAELAIACDQLEKREGMVFPGEWREIYVASRNVPTLFEEGMIFTGSSSGMIDPFAGFGIQAALFSGGIAAKAVSDPEAAAREFKWFNRYYTAALSAWVGMQWVPYRFGFLKAALANPKLFKAAGPLVSGFVPGAEDDWVGKVLENIRPL